MPPVPCNIGELGSCLPIVGTTYVTTGEVTTLEHEVGDDAVERRASIAVTLLAGAESAEVLGSLGDNVIVELEVDTTGLLC